MQPYKQVIVIFTPITERYWREGDEASIDLDNNMIRLGGCWFKLDERFIYKEISDEKI